jgi:hypothetical protein
MASPHTRKLSWWQLILAYVIQAIAVAGHLAGGIVILPALVIMGRSSDNWFQVLDSHLGYVSYCRLMGRIVT